MTVAHSPGGGGGGSGGNKGNNNANKDKNDDGGSGDGGGGGGGGPASTNSAPNEESGGGGGGGHNANNASTSPLSSSNAPMSRLPSTATTETSSSPSDLSSPTPPTEKTNDATTPPPTSAPTAAAASPNEEAPAPSAEDLLSTFPVAKLTKLEELISNPRWVIPVLPGAELEVLLETSIILAREGLDGRSEACMRFYREGLLTSFTKIMTDEAVSSWRQDIHKYILKNCERLMELCVLKLQDDWFPLLDLLGLVLNPGNKFHIFNAGRPSENPDQKLEERLSRLAIQSKSSQEEEEETAAKAVFAQSGDIRQPKGWLVDLVNRFGHLGGFDKILDRFVPKGEGKANSETELTVPLIHALVKPFGQCSDLLTQSTVTTYLLPVVEVVPRLLESMSEEELKKDTKGESKNDALATIVKSLKSIAATVPGQEESVRQLEMFRLKMILRQLQVSSFGGKMSALNEVNRVISSVSFYSPQQRNQPSASNVSSAANSGAVGNIGAGEDEDFLTAERMAAWLKENKVLQIVLQDSLHQPQYVEKLEKVIRFLIKEHTLTLSDLDDIWAAQVGQHEAIVKNVHDLLAKLAWDFSPEQLDHLFECFQRSWNTAPPKQREKLLELIRRLAEDDKDGVMAEKVLTLFWNLAHNPDTSTDLMDQALAAHIKILDYSCTQYRDSQKTRWLDRCIDELKKDGKWVLPALKQIKEICCLYTENPPNAAVTHGAQRTPAVMYRHEIINKLQSSHALVIVVADNLTGYMDLVRRTQPRKILEGDPTDFYPDGRYNHILQVQERLSFLRFLLKDGQLWLCAPQAKQIWNCLAENAVFAQDREACFKWFSKLMGEEPDLDPEINRDFFENNILQLDPALMTESGIRCFDRFFKAVNSKENKLIPKRRAFLMDDLELIGMDYIWRLVNCSSDEIASRAIDLLKETWTNLGPRLQANQVEIHEDFVSSCFDRLRASYDTVTVIERDKKDRARLTQELTRLCRVLQVLREYVAECDCDYGEERLFPPLFRACRGKQVALTVRFPNQGRQFEDLELWTHANDTLGSVRRQVVQRLKVSPTGVRLELFVNGEVLDVADDRKTLGVLPQVKDKAVLTGKLSPVGNSNNLVSSPESSSDSSTSSPRHHYEGGAGGLSMGPNLEAEEGLPGVIISTQPAFCLFLLQLADLGCSLNHQLLTESARAVLKLIPADRQTVDRLKTVSQENMSGANTKKNANQIWDAVFFPTSPSQTLYNLEIAYSMLMPGATTIIEKTFDFQLAFCKARGIPAMMNMLTKNNFLSKVSFSISYP